MTIASSSAAVDAKSRPAQSLAELLRRGLGMRVEDLHLSEVRITGLCSDSRLAHPGSLFVAIPGNKGDGAAYIADATARGAVAVVADREVSTPHGAHVVRVPCAREAVSRLAAHFFGLDQIQSRNEMSVVGVTGTNGKSTIAYMLRAILKAAGRPSALFGTIEYDLVSRKIDAALTTPDPIDLIRHLVEAHGAGARDAVMEVSSHSLDQHRTAGIRFATGVFTNLTQDHLDYHVTMAAYAQAKERLFRSLAGDATAVVNTDDATGEFMLEHCRSRKIRYGIDSGDLRAESVVVSRDGCRFRIVHEGRRTDATIALAGRHNVYNALAAVGASLSLGLDMTVILRGLASLDRVPGRLQRVDTGALGFDVFVDYAHTDDALRNVLTALRPLTKGRLCCVFGCGGDRDRTKRPRMAQAVAEFSDAFLITSDNPRTEDPLAIIADIESGLTAEARIRGVTEPDRATAIDLAVRRLRQGDVLLIAGKGHEDYQIIGTEKIHFDDVEVAAAAIERVSNGQG